MGVRFTALYFCLVAIYSVLFVDGRLLANRFVSYPYAVGGDSVVVERQHLIELPVQYEYVPMTMNNGQISLHTRIDGSSYNNYYQTNQGYASTNLQQQHFSGYQYQVPQAQLPSSGLIRPSIVTTTPLPPSPPIIQIAAAAPPAPAGQVEIDPNVIKSLVG